MSEKNENWLTEAYDYQPPQRGEIREGILLELDDRGAVVDVGLKADGLVPQEDIKKIDEETLSEMEPGQEVTTQVLRPQDREGDLILSLSYAQELQDWQKAQTMLEQDEIWRGHVDGYNKGGLLVKFGQIQSFVPASHLWRWRKQKTELKQYVDQEISLKFIEVDQETNRLVASERLATEQERQQTLETLLDELEEGQIRRGVVRHLTNYGAFVDLGGADGLIHISELSWRQISHPKEVVQVGDEIDVYVLKIDHQRQRIALSLKRLKPDPWTTVDDTYQIDQLAAGVVTNVVDFGAFVALESGVEGLVHISELADPPPHRPHDFVEEGEEVIVRILRIDSQRQRIELSLKRVSDQEREAWLAEQTQDSQADADEENSEGTQPDTGKHVSASHTLLMSMN